MAAKELLRKWMMNTVAVGVVLSLFSGVGAKPQAPCYFIFGDSLVDNGNNNVLQSLARADYLPYGIDFNGGPTGRFSNGKTNVDVIAELLGFDDYITPYVTVSGQDILKGVNFASAAAGIKEETGQHLELRISFSRQVQNHQNTVSQILAILGDEKSTANYLSRCLYSIGMGSNDYLDNNFMPQLYSSSRQFSPVEYANVLIESYAQKLRCLHSYGARKMVLFGIGQIGCSPDELAQNSQDGTTCVERINSANQIFNNRMKSLVDQLNEQLSDARFVYINSYGIFQHIINNSSAYYNYHSTQEHVRFIFSVTFSRIASLHITHLIGFFLSLDIIFVGFKVANAGCCGVGGNHGQITCLPMQIPCENRREYLFWDAYHPTERETPLLRAELKVLNLHLTLTRLIFAA